MKRSANTIRDTIVQIKQETRNTKRMLYPTRTEKLDILERAGATALLLYQEYLGKAAPYGSPDFSDRGMHRTCPPLSVRQVKENRLKLTKLGYFRQEMLPGKTPDQTKIIIKLGRGHRE